MNTRVFTLRQSPLGEPETTECTQTEDDIRRFGDIVNAGGATTVTKFRAFPLQSALVPMLRDKTQQVYVIGAYSHGQGSFVFAGVKIAADNISFSKVIAAIKGWVQYETQGRKP